MVIARGDEPDVLAQILAGEEVGTIFLPSAATLTHRKRWIAFFQHPAGVVVVDDGAATAIRREGKSLLKKGVVRTTGQFTAGELVSIHDQTGVEFARGLVKTTTGSVLVHRDDLVIL
jgi:glutamate 5-kinase